MTYQKDLNAPTLANSLASYFSQNCQLPDEDKQWFFNILLLLSETLSEGNACYMLSNQEQKQLEGYAKDLLVPVMLNPVFEPQKKTLKHSH